MPKAVVRPWYEYLWRGLTVIASLGVIGLAVTAGKYMSKVDRLESLYEISKEISELKRDVAVLQERTKGSNSPFVPQPIELRPAAGKQR